jgi:hypothetical protein
MIEPADVIALRPPRGAFRNLVTVDLGRKPSPPAVAFPAPRRSARSAFSSGRGTDLAIDFGTSAIAAALVGGTYAVEVLSFGGEKLLPAPFGRRSALDRSRLADNYELSYGYLGGGAGPRGGEEYYPCLKRRIEWLARTRCDTGWQSEAVLDVAAVCQLALDKARDERGRRLAECLTERFRVYITVPNAFPRAAVDVLRRGVGYGVAAALGRPERPEVEALLEAEAVAYSVVAGPRLSEAGRKTTLLVIDAGAGTTDASIVRVEDGELRVSAHVGLPVGGMDLDAFIAGLKGPIDGSRPPSEVSQWLAAAEQAKQHHLGAPRTREDGLSGLARELVRLDAWPPNGRGGRPIEEEIGGAWERYMALAVRGLIRALPADEVARVEEVVLSGRASLLAGFEEVARHEVAARGPAARAPAERGPGSPVAPRCRDGAEERKLAVVRGVGAYVSSTYGSRWDRRPLRASFEIFLRHEDDRELPLVPAGCPLVRGWGVAAWSQPERPPGRGDVRPRVEMRLVPREVLRGLAAEGTFGAEDLEDLLRWSVLPVLRIDRESPPYSARLAFDFLSLDAQLEVDSARIRELDRPESSFGRRHPVHQLEDNWFELSQ